MAKAKTNPEAKRSDETDLQWRSRIAARRQYQRDKAEPIVPIHTERHGDYRQEFVTNVEDGSKARTSINRGGSPICRWKAAGSLSQSQQAAIDYMVRLWGQAGLQQRVTANYGPITGGNGNAELRAINEIEAREDLHRIQAYVPKAYWNVFEAVVRFDEPAGVAGSALANSSRNAKHTAYLIVCFCADIIAMKEGL